MKKFVFLLVFIILVPVSMASVLFEGQVENRETFKAGEHYFSVLYIEASQILNFKMDDMGGLMVSGECETRGNIRYCFEGVDGSKIKVKIESLEPDVSIERSFSTTKPDLGGEVTVTVTLKNEGDKIAGNVKYMDRYPSGIKVYYIGNTAKWEGSLNAGEEEKFTYTIKAEDVVSFDSIATVSYQFEGKEKIKKSSSVTIDVQKPFSIAEGISTEAADKNEIVIYNLTITNKGESRRLSIENLEISFPSKLSLVSASTELKKGENKLTFTGTLEKKESKTFFIRVKSTRVGSFKIATSADIKIAGKSFKEELEKSFNVGLSNIIPILNVTSKVKSNSPYNIYIAIKNYGKEEIKNVSIKVESDLFDDVGEKRNIAAGSTYDVFKKKLTAPYVGEDKKYNVKISGSYVSSSGKTRTFEKSAQLTITAPPKIIQIIRELNKEEFYPGDEIKIVIKVKNQKNKVVDSIDVSDIFPKEIRSSLMGDVVGYLEKLGPNEEKKVYSYSVVVPEGYKEDEIEFKTTVNTKVDGELVILKRIDDVKVLHGEKPEGIEEEQKKVVEERESQKEDVEKGEQDTEDVEEEEIGEEKKPNVFVRMINWVKNLFGKKS